MCAPNRSDNSCFAYYLISRLFTYIMHTDLGGDLPPEAINARLAESTMDDLRRLKALAEG